MARAVLPMMIRHARLLRVCRSVLPQRAVGHSPVPNLFTSWSCSHCRIHARRHFATSSDASSTAAATDTASSASSVSSASTAAAPLPPMFDPWARPDASSLLPPALRTGDPVKDRATLRALNEQAAAEEEEEEGEEEEEDDDDWDNPRDFTPEQPRMQLPPNHDTLNDDLPIPPDSDGMPIPNPPYTAYPLPPLPPLPRGADLFPSPTPTYHAHRSGSSIDCFKHTVLLHLFDEMCEAYGTSITYVGVGGGGAGVASDMSNSLLRQSGIDCVYEYGRWFARLARSSHHTIRHSFIPLMQAVRAVNGGNKLDRGFQYYPGNAAIIRHAMRPQDRAVFFESDTQLARQLVEYFNNGEGDSDKPAAVPPLRADRVNDSERNERSEWAMKNRVVVHPLNGFSNADNRSGSGAYNPLVALGRPLTSHALFHFDLTKERYENVRHMQERLGTHILPKLFSQYPTATFVTSLPLYGNTLPYDVVRWHLRGHRDVFMVRMDAQEAARYSDERERNRDDDEEEDGYSLADLEDEEREAEDEDQEREAEDEKEKREAEDENEEREKAEDEDEDEVEDEDEIDSGERNRATASNGYAAEQADEEMTVLGDSPRRQKTWEQGAEDAYQGNYMPFGGPYNTSIPIDEPWGVAMIIVKPPAGFDAVTLGIQEDLAEVRDHIPHVGLVDVDEDQVMADEAAAGDGVKRSEEQRQAILDEVMEQMRPFDEPDYVWLTRRHIDSIDYDQAWDWYNDRNFSYTASSPDTDFKRKEQMVLQTEGPSAVRAQGRKRNKVRESPGFYYNEAKLIADMARPYRGPVIEAGKKGKRRAADTEADKPPAEHVDVNVSDEVKQAAERVHENEGRLLEAWKREMQQRTTAQ